MPGTFIEYKIHIHQTQCYLIKSGPLTAWVQIPVWTDPGVRKFSVHLPKVGGFLRKLKFHPGLTLTI